MNKVILMGRLTKAPEIKDLQDDNKTAMARYTLAVERRFGKNREREADFIPCMTFGKNAESYLKKEPRSSSAEISAQEVIRTAKE